MEKNRDMTVEKRWKEPDKAYQELDAGLRLAGRAVRLLQVKAADRGNTE